MAPPSRLAGSMFMPAPGCTRLAMIMPSNSARVVTTSKYMKVLKPTLPSSFRLSIRAMPMATVQKITRVMSILIRRMNVSPSGFISTPSEGQQ
ncbi:hypothetical protein D3C76_1544880 [compost metagenome]